MLLSVVKKTSLAFILALLLLSGIGFVSYRSTLDLTADAELVKHTHEVLERLESLLSLMTDAETGQRGFLITGNDEFLEPYDRAVKSIGDEFDHLKRLTSDNATQQQRLEQLAPVMAKRLAAASKVIETRRSEGFDAAKAALIGNQGKQLHDYIRQIIGEMKDDELRLLSRHEAVTKTSTRRTLLVIVLGSVVALVCVVGAQWIIVLDLAKRRRAEALLQAANLELSVQTERALTADRLKSAFLATMSHELRTPLNSILGFTGFILQGLAGPLNAKQTKQLEMVRGSSRHLLELINDVLDISKIEAGQLEMTRAPFNVRMSIDKVIGVVGPLAKKEGVPLHVHMPATMRELISDQRRFEQILLNLLSNAIKFTAQGDVSLSAEIVSRSVTNGDAGLLNDPHDVLCVSVSDTGIGIKPDDLASLFQPFRQIETDLSRTHEGTGLGLAISRRLAELLGGEIHAASEYGKGSVFTLKLPFSLECGDLSPL